MIFHGPRFPAHILSRQRQPASAAFAVFQQRGAGTLNHHLTRTISVARRFRTLFADDNVSSRSAATISSYSATGPRFHTRYERAQHMNSAQHFTYCFHQQPPASQPSRRRFPCGVATTKRASDAVSRRDIVASASAAAPFQLANNYRSLVTMLEKTF